MEKLKKPQNFIYFRKKCEISSNLAHFRTFFHFFQNFFDPFLEPIMPHKKTHRARKSPRWYQVNLIEKNENFGQKIEKK